MKSSIPKKNRALILRTCDADMRSHEGQFTWPVSGRVEAPDWEPTKACGDGLHGFLHGEGAGQLANWNPDAKWIAAWVDISLCIDLGGKVKFPWCVVAFVGDRTSATDFLRGHGCNGPIVGGTATAGDRGTATAGYGGTATAGYGGTATAGDRGTATAGYGGTATAGYEGTATAGVGGTATAGYRGTATAGVGGTATAGVGGTATAGVGGTATAGDRGTATAGDGGTATAGDRGTATAGDRGILNIRYWDGKRYRIATFYVGEDKIKPNVDYRCDGKGRAIRGVDQVVTALIKASEIAEGA